MQGLMQRTPLLISSAIEYAALYHPAAEIVSRPVEPTPLHHSNYKTIRERAIRAAIALQNVCNVKIGDRVGTLAWNGYRHLELYFGISGFGAILHTVNPRLFPEQIEYIINHAEDAVLFFDLTFIPLVEKIMSTLHTVKHFVIMTDSKHMPNKFVMHAASQGAARVHCYETLLASVNASQISRFQWPVFDENLASSLCYTSGTTGHPKGVLYSHRSTLLHALASLPPDSACGGLSSSDCVLVIVPLFHANAWGMPYVAPLVGAKLLLPGPHLDGKSLCDLIRAEKPTYSSGVPSVFLMILQYLEEHPELDVAPLSRVTIGGSAVPREMLKAINRRMNCRVIHAWGMTEMSPLGVVGQLLPKHVSLSSEEKLDVLLKQGRAMWGVELKITDDDNRELPRDGKTFGNLKVRGPWVTCRYFKDDKLNVDNEEWFNTGDVATLDPDGYMQITDRSKDVIKSGGEWISSIDLENEVMGHPKVGEAAVIGVRHLKWQERPLLLIVPKKNATVTKEEVLNYLKDRVVAWWLPDDVLFMKELPHTATGKLLKSKLRQTYGEHLIKLHSKL